MTDSPQTPGSGEAAQRPSAARQVVEFILTLAIAFLVAQAIRVWVVQPYIVPSGSMLPTIQLNDHVLGNKFVYHFRAPQAGEIIVFDNPMNDPMAPTLIKRCIAVGGQTVDLRDGHVVIDGKVLDEPYTHGQMSDPLPGSTIKFPVKLPLGYVWAMGDNRTQSEDSRWFGPVKISSVQAQGFFIYWPLSRFGVLK